MANKVFNLDRVGAALSEAVLNPERWPQALEIVSAETGSYGAVILPLHRTPTHAPASPSLDRATEFYLQQGWANHDYRYKGTERLMRSGIATDFDFISEDAIKRHPYYQDFLARFRLSGWACVRLGYGLNSWSLALQRTLDQEHYQPGELRQLQALSMQSASLTAVSEALNVAKAESSLQSFDASGDGAVLLGPHGEVLRANSKAEQILGRELVISGRKLTATDKTSDVLLQKAIRDVVWRPKTFSAKPIRLQRDFGAGILLHMLKIPAITDVPLSPYTAVIVFRDLDERAVPNIRALEHLFELTPAEARLAQRLAQGENLNEIASSSNTSRETLRSHLKSVFAKSNVNRQSDLVAMLQSILPN